MTRTKSEIEITERSPEHPDAARMLREFYQEQVGRYGFAESIDLDPAQYAPPAGTFVVVYARAAAVGCGGCRLLDAESATFEIKKTYLDPVVRGRGVGRELLEYLEDHAVRSGARRVILETGVRNTVALGLFASAGYQPMASYVAGRDPAINRAFMKTITGSACLSAEDPPGTSD